MTQSDMSLCFSDDDDCSCCSHFYSTNGDEYTTSGSVSDIEVGCVENERNKDHLGKVEKECRICHLGLESESEECGVPIELGCSCKGDLSVAHINCAQAWFKIKGNRTCEICDSIAHNIIYGENSERRESLNENNNNVTSTTTEASTITTEPSSETSRFWHFLLACMVFAFVISWLFHFNLPQ